MVNCLHSIFQEIAKATNEQELRLAVMNTVGEHFDVQSWGLYLLDDNCQEDNYQKYSSQEGNFRKDNSPEDNSPEDNSRKNIEIETIPDVCLKGNPVGQYVFERHAPAHEELVLSPGDWQKFCNRNDHAHVMSGPIITDGRVVGTLNLTRSDDAKAFDTHDLADLSALCLHLSTKLATIRAESANSKSTESKSTTSDPTTSDSTTSDSTISESRKSKLVLTNSLTPREQQIAELVAKGLTNAEIGKQLWITQNSVKQALKRMFRKLGVSARTEMVAKVFSEVQLQK